MIDDEKLMELYNKSFVQTVQLSEEYSVLAVAATLLGQSMRLYKTVLDEDEFYDMIEAFTETVGEIKPYDPQMIAEGSTIH
mgnify:CR=1 FL=1